MGANVKKVAATDTFIKLLTRGTSKIKDDRADRLAKSASMAFDAKVAKMKKDIWSIEDALENLTDCLTDNISVSSFNSDEFVNKRAKLLIAKRVAEKELESLLEDESFYKV